MKSTRKSNKGKDASAKKKWITVDPANINRALFESQRVNEQEELTRKRILAGLDAVKEQPQKYGRIFEVRLSKKDLYSFSEIEIERYSKEVGDGLEDYIQKYLEWGQTISKDKGSDDVWKKLCQLPNSKKCQLIKGKNGDYWITGNPFGGCEIGSKTRITKFNPLQVSINSLTVPAIVRYK